jgi:hypothetical protein
MTILITIRPIIARIDFKTSNKTASNVCAIYDEPTSFVTPNSYVSLLAVDTRPIVNATPATASNGIFVILTRAFTSIRATHACAHARCPSANPPASHRAATTGFWGVCVFG